MSLLLSCQAISKAYGAAPLFEQLSFGLFEGDRDPSVAANAVVLQQRYEALREAQEHVDDLYARWAELAEKQTQP